MSAYLIDNGEYVPTRPTRRNPDGNVIQAGVIHGGIAIRRGTQ